MHKNAGMINADGRFPFINVAKRELAQTGQLDPSELTPQQRFLRHDASELKGASQLLAGLHTLNPYCRERLAQQMSDCVTLLG